MKQIKLPEPWCKMTAEQITALPEDELRELSAAVHSPKLDELRATARKLSTSMLVLLVANAEQLTSRLIPDEVIGYGPDCYDDDDAGLVMMAGTFVVGDALDERIPVP